MADPEVVSSSPLATGGPAAFSQIQQTTQTAMVALNQKLQLPPFTPSAVTPWFQRAEVNFRLARITDEATRADMVLSMLTPDIFKRLSPWLRTRPGTILYEDLKAQLIHVYSLPVPLRAQRALDLLMTPMGDARPSEAWDELVELLILDEVDANGRPREICLSREIFLRRLPQNVRAQLKGAQDMEMDDLVRRAEQIHFADQASKYAATPSVNAVAAESTEADLTEADIFAVHQRRPFPQRPRHHKQHHPAKQQQQRSRPPGAPNQPGSDVPPWCYFHRCWGSNAQKCQPPCQYPKN